MLPWVFCFTYKIYSNIFKSKLDKKKRKLLLNFSNMWMRNSWHYCWNIKKFNCFGNVLIFIKDNKIIDHDKKRNDKTQNQWISSSSRIRNSKLSISCYQSVTKVICPYKTVLMLPILTFKSSNSSSNSNQNSNNIN